jgi:hypothetical protein
MARLLSKVRELLTDIAVERTFAVWGIWERPTGHTNPDSSSPSYLVALLAD